MNSHRLAVVAVLALVVLAGCSGAGGGDGEPSSLGDGGATAAPDAESGDGGGGDAGGPSDRANEAPEGTPAAQSADSRTGTVSAGRALIYTGRATIEVDDYDAAREDIATLARNRGGFVAASSESQHVHDNRSWTTGRIVIRVPSDSFRSTFAAVKGTGEVLDSNSETTDVTDQLVDLNARLKNLRAQRDRLRTLYERANDTEAVLEVGQRLSEVQGEIERLEARKRALKDRVAYSTITVELREPKPPRVTPTPTPTPTPEPAYYDTSLGSAFAASINGVVVTVRTLAVSAAYALPYLLVFGIPLGAVAAVVYRRDLL